MFIGTNVHSIDFFTEDPINEAAEEGAHVNTWDDWHLVATSRPTISLPKFQENNVEITGMNGFVDVSRVLTGYPLYGARTGSIEFLILNQYNINNADYWTQTYHKVAHFLHGQRRKMVLHDDERNYYYDGVFTVDSFEPGENNSTITINYVLQPFKKARRLSDEEWIWDPFDLDYGITMNRLFKDWETDSPIYPPSDTNNKIVTDYIGSEPVVPNFYVTFTKEYDSEPDTRTFVFPDVDNSGKVTEIDARKIEEAFNRAHTGEPYFYDIFYHIPQSTEAPPFVTDTYYKFEEFGVDGGYVLLDTEPSDWSTNYTSYYMLYSKEEQFDRADADRDGLITLSDRNKVRAFYGECSVRPASYNTLEGWTDFMGNNPSEIVNEVQIRVYCVTAEGRVSNESITLFSDGREPGGDDTSLELVSETDTERTFKAMCPHIVLYGDYAKIILQGKGKVSISFREGRL